MATGFEEQADDSAFGSAFSCAFVSLLLTTALVMFARDVVVFYAAVVPAVIASTGVALFAGPRRPVYALGVGAAAGGVFPFATWIAQHIGNDQPASTIFLGWLAAVVVFAVVASVLGSVAAWATGRLRHR